jgi:hypothetical protein
MRLRVVVVLLAVACCSFLLLTLSSAGATLTPRVYFDFEGTVQGTEKFYGFISVKQPYGYTGSLQWNENWSMACHTDIANLTPGTQFGCNGPVYVTGKVKKDYVSPLVGQDCTGALAEQENAQWGAAGQILSRTTLKITASGPPSVIAIISNPADSGCAPDEAIKWLTDPNIIYTGPLTNHVAARSNGQGVYTNTQPTTPQQIRGHVHLESHLFLQLAARHP